MAFRVALTFLSISASLTVLVDWLGQRPFQSLRGQPTSIRYVLQHSSNPRVLICIALIVLICAVQIALVWRTPLARHWWAPLLTEVGLCVAFALAYHQIFGGFGFGCGQRPDSCFTWWPPLVRGSAWVVYSIIGLTLGLVWSVIGRRGGSLTRAEGQATA